MNSDKKLEELDSKSLDEISGGYLDGYYDTEDIRCDNCGKSGAVPIPSKLTAGLCTECMKSLRERFGEDFLLSVFSK